MIELNVKMTIGELVSSVPGSEIIIDKYFHGGCHHCPSKNSEPLWIAAKLYNLDADEILNEFINLHNGSFEPNQPVIKITARERRMAREQLKSKRE